MNETPIRLDDIAALAILANGIIPADSRDAGAASVHAGPTIAARMRRSPYAAIYVEGLAVARRIAFDKFEIDLNQLDSGQTHELMHELLREVPAFFRQLRADVCALYLSDAGVWQRIGFPGPSAETGGYPDFDQPQF